ncbi:hypothetical protein WJX73_004029 [Symbiochloris irregularis]|uniref:Glycoside hydrolase family 5 domain-containing protein n=1 Tax=Symbiochloris irregularis TaxID=706552 RepID=A0AAW1NXH0_9CHLO
MQLRSAAGVVLAILAGCLAQYSSAQSSAPSPPPGTPPAPPSPGTPINSSQTPVPTEVLPLNGSYLTTKDQANGPTIIVNEHGEEVVINGLGWFGFNTGGTAPLDLTKGTTALSQDFNMIVWRMKMLGFNAIRLPFIFDSHWGLGLNPPTALTRACVVPNVTGANSIDGSMIPPAFPNLPLGNTNSLPQAPPTVNEGICNYYMPADSTLTRFVWVVEQFIAQGFYVNLDYHGNKYTDSLGNAQGKLFIDLVNEPDGFGINWEAQPLLGYPGLKDLYLHTIDALYPICPSCIFLVEGTGQDKICGNNWGNGFATNQTLVKTVDVSDPTPFFRKVLQRPWLAQLVIAPHFYCPGVSQATECYAGPTQWQGFDDTVGYLSVAPGFCDPNTKKCKVFSVIVDEFGSTLNSTVETSCMTSIIAYMNAAPETGNNHAPMLSWYYWAWQPQSNGTGGMVGDDWTTIRWDKVNSLTGGTNDWPEGVGMAPWYLKAFNQTAPTFAVSPLSNEPLNVTIVNTATPALPGIVRRRALSA